MSRNTPKTFAEARAITDPIRRADALLKLSQEAEDRRRSQTTMRKVEGQVLSDEQIAALTAFLAEWEADADNFGDEQELMDSVRDAIDGGVLPDDFDRVFNAAYQATVDEYNNPSPNLGYDAEGFARALTDLLNTVEGSSYEPNTRDSEKAARPAMRKAGRGNNIGVVHYTEDGNVFWTVTMNGLSESAAFPDVDKYNGAGDGEKRARRQAEKLYAQANSPKRMFERDGDTGEETDIKSDDGTGKAARPAMRKAGYASRDQIVASMKWGEWDSKGKTRIGTSSLVPGAKFIILKEPIQGYKYQLLVDYNGEKSQIDKNDDPNKLMRHPPAHWIEGNMPDREPDSNDAGDQQAYVASARSRMRKADSAIIDNFCEDAKSLFNKLMADDYFSKAYTPGDLASAALIITYKKSGSDSPTSKKVVRETGNRYL